MHCSTVEVCLRLLELPGESAARLSVGCSLGRMQPGGTCAIIPCLHNERKTATFCKQYLLSDKELYVCVCKGGRERERE